MVSCVLFRVRCTGEYRVLQAVSREPEKLKIICVDPILNRNFYFWLRVIMDECIRILYFIDVIGKLISILFG